MAGRTKVPESNDIRALGIGNALTGISTWGDATFTIRYKVTALPEASLTVSREKITLASRGFEISFGLDGSFTFKSRTPGAPSTFNRSNIMSATSVNLLKSNFQSGSPVMMKLALIASLEEITKALEKESPGDFMHKLKALAASMGATREKLSELESGVISKFARLIDEAVEVSGKMDDLSLKSIPKLNALIRQSKAVNEALMRLEIPELEAAINELKSAKESIASLLPGEMQLVNVLDKALYRLENEQKLDESLLGEIGDVERTISGKAEAATATKLVRFIIPNITKVLKGSKFEIKQVPFSVSLRSAIDAANRSVILNLEAQGNPGEFIDML
ncbi:MAG: hypothetical protein LVQ95_05065 [Candidatus Micrarchaeales archaeon]|nr:hypothetical protein [Candidatus Micrarchaeales archaeon]